MRAKNDSLPHHSSLQQWCILLRTYGRIQRTKIAQTAAQSRLKSLTVFCFLAIYAVSAYLLLERGFDFVSRLPAAGGIVVDRLIHVVFFCFMIMLIFSSAVTAYISIYRGKDVPWLLSLPVEHRVTFLWKCFESAIFSSWGLVIMIAPLLVSFAQQRDVSFGFYAKSFLALIPFLVICCSAGSILLILVGRFLNRRQFAAIAVCVAVIVIWSIIHAAVADKKIVQDTGLSSALAFQRVLSHTNVAANRFMPSAWLSSLIVEWSRPFGYGRNWLLPCLLLSNAMMLPLVLSWLAKTWFFRSWNRGVQSNAKSAAARISKKKDGAVLPGKGNDCGARKFALMSPILGRSMGAVAKKDLLTFVREPAQWAQFTLVFGLLAIYASGLNRLHDEIDQPRDLYLVAFLNLAVSALALSTLTTRFVFPQFSLEGQRLWILAMSPVRLSGIVIQKFVSSSLATGCAMIIILVVSSHNLRFGLPDTVFFSSSVFFLALGLNALAVGLGVLFPNLRESNTAKIVSGFGGTLCLVASFLYIVLFVVILVAIRSEVFIQNKVNENWITQPKSLAGFLLLIALTLITTTLPLYASIKKLKSGEIIGKIL